jgi:3-hydroxybutyryl-CoA dehydrogenase
MQTPRIAIIGAGLMGVGIATHFARHGHSVLLRDVSAERLADVTVMAKSILEELSAAGSFDAAETTAVLQRIKTSDSLADVAGATLLIEAIPERLALKHALYAELESIVSPDTIIASNTSGFPPDQLAQGMAHPERLLIAHFWNPPHLIPLVELVPGEKTEPSCVQAVQGALQVMGLEVVLLKHAIPGFIGNRLQFAVLREALHIVQSGAASPEDVDRVMRASLGRRYSMVGPLEAADMGGLDTFLDIASHLMPVLAKDEDVLNALRERVAQGKTGLRSGAGFYEWDEERKARIAKRRTHQLSHALRP